MYIYRNKSRFYVSPWGDYLPAGAMIARYEGATKIVVQNSPRSDVDPFNTLVDGFELDDPAKISWIYEIEPPPLGNNTKFFEVVGRKDEDGYGNVGGTSDGLPDDSLFRIDVTTGIPYIYNADTGLYYPLRVTGPDGNVYLEVGQVGVPISQLS